MCARTFARTPNHTGRMRTTFLSDHPLVAHDKKYNKKKKIGTRTRTVYLCALRRRNRRNRVLLSYSTEYNIITTKTTSNRKCNIIYTYKLSAGMTCAATSIGSVSFFYSSRVFVVHAKILTLTRLVSLIV